MVKNYLQLWRKQTREGVSWNCPYPTSESRPKTVPTGQALSTISLLPWLRATLTQSSTRTTIRIHNRISCFSSMRRISLLLDQGGMQGQMSLHLSSSQRQPSTSANKISTPEVSMQLLYKSHRARILSPNSSKEHTYEPSLPSQQAQTVLDQPPSKSIHNLKKPKQSSIIS